MQKFKLGFSTVKDFLLHLAIMVLIGIIGILFFFFFYLPNSTNHGETITVPNLMGIHYDELGDYLTKRNLRFEIRDDSSFSSEFPALTVLQQYPRANSKVKENRKIYLSLNAKNPPTIKMPRLIDGSVKNAQMVLKSYDLVLGEIKYVPDLAQNAVLRQFFEGKEIKEGTPIPKGATIDLEVGDGLGNQEFVVPNLIGLDFEDAEFSIIGSGLRVGLIIKSSIEKVESEMRDGRSSSSEDEERPEPRRSLLDRNNIQPGMVYRQKPRSGERIRIGDTIDLWIVEGTDIERNEDDEASLLD